MNRKFFKYLLITIQVLISISCKYELEEISETILDATPTVKVESINLVNAPDTILLLNSANIQYNIEVNGHQDFDLEVFLDDTKVHSSNSTNGTFRLNPYYQHQGYHQLTLRVLTNSGTGSMLDKLGGEKLVFEKNWVIEMDNLPPDKLKFSQIFYENGVLIVEWEPTSRKNFDAYQFSALIDGYSICNKKIEVKDRQQTRMDLPFYIGGNLKLTGSIASVNNDQVSYDYINYNAPNIILESRKSADGTPLFQWNRSPYFKYFENYVIHDKLMTYIGDTVFNTSDVNANVYKFNDVPFGNLYTFSFTQVPNSEFAKCEDHYNRFYYSRNYDIFKGFRTPDFKTIKSIENETTVFYVGRGNVVPSSQTDVLYYINIVGADLSSIPQSSFDISNNGDYILAGSRKEKILRFNKNTYQLEETIGLSDLNTGYQNEFSVKSLAVSNNGLVVMSVASFSRAYNLISYDIVNKEQKDLYRNSNINDIKIGPNGDYVLWREENINKMAKLTDGIFGDIMTIDVGDYPIIYGDNFFTFENDNVYIYDPATLEIIKTIKLDESIVSPTVDKITGNFAGVNVKNEAVIFDHDGKILTKIQLAWQFYANFPNWKSLFLHNNELYYYNLRFKVL